MGFFLGLQDTNLRPKVPMLSPGIGRQQKFSHTGFQGLVKLGIDSKFCPQAILSAGELACMVSLKVNFYCPQQPISVAKVTFVIYQDGAAQWNNELPQ